jgi:hypothetical protein
MWPAWLGEGPAVEGVGASAGIASPGLTREEARAQADFYRERCAAYGKQSNPIALRRDIYVGESSADAQTVLQQALSKGYRGIPAEAPITGSRRGGGAIPRLRGTRLHRRYCPPSHQRSAEGPRLPGAAGKGARGAGLAALGGSARAIASRPGSAVARSARCEFDRLISL